MLCGSVDARRAANLRPEQLAVAIDRSAFQVQSYEAGRATPPVNVLARIADTLDRPVDAFLAEPEAVERVAG